MLYNADGIDIEVPDELQPKIDMLLRAAHREGHREGLDAGYDAGYEFGQVAGYDDGYDAGWDKGLDVGYDSGYATCQNHVSDLAHPPSGSITS